MNIVLKSVEFQFSTIFAATCLRSMMLGGPVLTYSTVLYSVSSWSWYYYAKVHYFGLQYEKVYSLVDCISTVCCILTSQPVVTPMLMVHYIFVFGCGTLGNLLVWILVEHERGIGARWDYQEIIHDRKYISKMNVIISFVMACRLLPFPYSLLSYNICFFFTPIYITNFGKVMLERIKTYYSDYSLVNTGTIVKSTTFSNIPESIRVNIFEFLHGECDFEYVDNSTIEFDYNQHITYVDLVDKIVLGNICRTESVTFQDLHKYKGFFELVKLKTQDVFYGDDLIANLPLRSNMSLSSEIIADLGVSRYLLTSDSLQARHLGDYLDDDEWDFYSMRDQHISLNLRFDNFMAIKKYFADSVISYNPDGERFFIRGYAVTLRCVEGHYIVVSERYLLVANFLEDMKNKYGNSSFTILDAYEQFCCYRVQSPLQGEILNNIIEQDWLIKLLEDMTVFYGLLSKSNDYKDVVGSIAIFSKLRCGNSLIVSSIRCYEQNLLDKLEEVFECSLQSSNPFTDFREQLKNYDLFKNSALYKKMSKFMMYALSTSLFSKIGFSMDKLNYTVVEQQYIKKKYKPNIDFYHCMLDTISYLCEIGYQMYVTGDVETIFHSDTKYAKWFIDVNELMRQSIYLNDLSEINTNEFTFLQTLDELIDTGLGIYKHAVRLKKGDEKIINARLTELLHLKSNILTLNKAKEHRDVPFSILIFGESGIGKSTIKDILIHIFAKKQNLKFAREMIYTRNPISKYWDGFRTCQWCVVLDDVAFMNPNAAPSGDPSVMEFIQIVNAVPFCPDQASLEDKGKTPMRCKMCVATTNTFNMNTHFYFSCPSAAQRRFPIVVEPKLKREFTGPDGTLRVPDDYVPSDGYPEYWTWTVHEVRPTSVKGKSKLANTKILLENGEMDEFLPLYLGLIDKYNKNMETVKKSIDIISNVDYCGTCVLPMKFCKCNLQFYSLWTYLGHVFLRFLDMLVLHFLFCIFRNNVRRYMSDSLGVTQILTWCLGCTPDQYLARKREYWERLGRDAYAWFTPPRILATLATIASGLYIINRMQYSFRSEVQGNVGSKPKATDSERQEVWYKDKYTLNTFDVGRKTLSLKGMCRSEFVNYIKGSVMQVVFRNNTDRKGGNMVCFGEQNYVTNNHLLIKHCVFVDIVQDLTGDGVSRNITVRIDPRSIVRIPERDLAFFRIRGLPPKKNIIDLFPPERINCRMNGVYVRKSHKGVLIEKDVRAMVYTPTSTIKNTDICAPMWTGHVDVDTVDGDCGSLLIGSSPHGPVLLGIHVTGCNGYIGALSILQKDLYDYTHTTTISPNEPALSSGNYIRELGELQSKSTIRYVQDGHAEVYGSFKGFRRKPKSKVCRTLMYKAIKDEGYKDEFFAPCMRSWEPWRIALLDMVQPLNTLSDMILDKCKWSFYRDIKDKLPKSELELLQPYDDFTAINGANGITYVDKINRNSSAGAPWNTSKKHFARKIPPQHDLMDPIEFDEEIMERVDNIFRTYDNDKRYMPVFTAHLKDEPVSRSKFERKKTRVFTGAPLDFTIVVRKMLLSHIRVIQRNRYVFEAGPGTIAQSEEWQEMFNYLTRFGENNIVAGDYQAFDKSMPANIMLAAFDILEYLARDSGNFTESELHYLRCIAYDICFPLVDFNGDLIQFYGTNPSGHPLTVIINSLVNSLYMRFCYYILNPNDSVDTFRHHVNLMTYGDDNIMGVSDSAKWFNHTSISKVLGEHGIVYTMADKKEKSRPYINIYEATFLKRSWYYEKTMKTHLAKLDHDSIAKMLTTWVRSNIAEEEQAVAVISSAMREYFFYGPEEYFVRRNMFKRIIKDYNLEVWCNDSTLPTWEELKQQYYDNSKHVNLE